MKVRKLFLSSLSLIVSGCVTVPNTKICSVAGIITAGADCAYTLSSKTEEMTLEEFIEFLEPQPERPDPNDPDRNLPARAGAICQSAHDWNRMKTALEQACKKLGGNCSYELKTAIRAASRRP